MSFFQPIKGWTSSYVQNTPPTEPPKIPVNSVWFDTSNQALWTWDGTRWNPMFFDASSLIAAGTILAGLIRANEIGADQLQTGAIDGETVNGLLVYGASIQGDTVVLSGAGDGVFCYGTSSATVKTFDTASGGGVAWVCPQGVTSIKAEVWAAGGSGSTFPSGGHGGSGGEYACEPAYATTPGNTYYYRVGAGGAAVTTISANGNDGNASWFNSVNSLGGVVANPGKGGNQGTGFRWPGGNGSVNTIHFNGGANGIAPFNSGSHGGAGGGGSGAPGSAGRQGGDSTSTSGAAGAASRSYGGGGGNGGSAPASNGGAGGRPGGGGGGCGGNGTIDGNSGAGGGGRVRLTYAATATPALTACIVGAAGTDPIGGNPVPQGIMGPTTAIQPGSNPVAAEVFHTVPALQNSWTQRNATGSTYPLSSYWINSHNELRLVLYLEHAQFSGTVANQLLFTLPSGYIPAHNHIEAIEVDNQGTPVAGSVPCVIIRGLGDAASGQVQAANLIGGTGTFRIHAGNIVAPMAL